MKRGSGILAVFAVVFCMLFSLWKETAVPIRAADGTFQKVTLSLNSNASDGASIDLYLRDSVHYIAIDDLCTLARCTRSVDGGLISVAQGIRRVEFQEDGTADCLPLDAASFPAQPEPPLREPVSGMGRISAGLGRGGSVFSSGGLRRGWKERGLWLYRNF